MPVERVWRAFTDSRVLERWTAPGASVTPREKGRMHIVFGADVELDAHIDVLVTRAAHAAHPAADARHARHRRGHRRGLPVRTRAEDATVVRLLSSGVPSAPAWVTYYLHKRRHWELALTRLKVFLEKGLDQAQDQTEEIKAMAGFILRGLLAALGLWAATEMLDGIHIDTATTLVSPGCC